MRELTCIARGREGQWEAICLDFNIAVSGNSFDQVRDTLSEAITYYIRDAMQEDERTREQLLNRRVPFWSRLQWTLPQPQRSTHQHNRHQHLGTGNIFGMEIEST